MRTDYINHDDYNRLYLHMSYENVLAMRVTLETGLRIGDVVALPADALDGRTLSFTAKKTGKRGRAVLSADLAKRLHKIAGVYFLFEHRTDVRKHRARQTVWKDVKQSYLYLVEHGELDGSLNVAPHSGRKTFAVEEFREHGLTETQRKLQHSRMDNTMIYAFSDMFVGGKNIKHSFENSEFSETVSETVGRIEEKIDTILEILQNCNFCSETEKS